MQKKQSRTNKVLDPDALRLLKLVAEGYSVTEIAKRLNCDKKKVVEDATRILKGLAQRLRAGTDS
jgi:DNA-binding NarL/FixJ family response regulator